MEAKLVCNDQGCRLVFAGRLTVEYARAMEDRIIEALRRFKHFEVDLSAVSEIDLAGVHLLGFLQAVGGDGVEIVASSPAVEQGMARHVACRRDLALPNGGYDHGGRRQGVNA